MKKENTNFGLKLNKIIHKVIKQRISTLTNSCPVNSTIKLKFEGSGSNLKGYLEVASFQFNSTFSYSGIGPLEVFYNLEDQLSKSLSEWDKRKFEKVIIKLMEV